MDVLVTGGAGYIGSVLAARLLARGYRVTVYDDLSRGHRAAVPDGADFVQGDIRDAAALHDALSDARCTSIMHMAALAEVGESVAQPERYHDVNVNGTAAVIAAAHSAGVDRLVFSSTAAVYGEPRSVPIQESHTPAPTNPYGETKLACERLLERARADGDLTFTALRYFNACGAAGAQGEDHDPETHLIPLALRAARGGTTLQVFGADYPTDDGTCVRDYVHVTDLADAHIAALVELPHTQSAFNLGTGSGASVRQVLDAVAAVTGTTVAQRVAARRPGDPPVLVASNARAGLFLGWKPQRTLEDAVRDAWEWQQAHPQGYED